MTGSAETAKRDVMLLGATWGEEAQEISIQGAE